MAASETAGTILKLDARRTFTDNPEDYAGMCDAHRERSQALHEALATHKVLDWGETDESCGDKVEPPITVSVSVALSSADEFVGLVRAVAPGVAAGRIDGLNITSPGVIAGRRVSGVTLSDVGLPLSLQLENLDGDQLRELFAQLRPFPA